MNKYSNFSKQELETFCINDDLREESLRNRLFLLTGCSCFGEQDGMTGCCVECSYENIDLFDRCTMFQKAVREYFIKRRKDEDE